MDRSKNSQIKAEESFPISEQGYNLGKLLDRIECQILLDTGACKSFMSKSYYMHCKSLHSLPKFTSKTQRIQVGNGQFVSVLFIIPVIVDMHTEIQKLIKVKAPFIDEISGLAIIKILDGSTYSTMVLKLKFICNTAMLDIVNNGTDTIIFKSEEMLGIVDLRSLGYYKIKEGILQQNLSKYYRFERADTLCEYFNKFINTLKKETEQKELEESYPTNHMHKIFMLRVAPWDIRHV